MFSFSRFRGTDDGRSDEDEVPDVKERQENEYGSGVGFDDYGNDSFEDVAERGEKSNGYTVRQVDQSLDQHNSDALEEGAESKEVKLNQVDLIHRLLDQHPPDFKNNDRTISCNSVENEKDEGRIRFDNVDTDGNSDENGEDDSRIGFDDGDTDSLDEVAESEEELNCYTVAQLKVKLAEQGLIQTGKKPDLVQQILNPQPSDFKKKAKLSRGEPARPKHFLSDSSVTNLHAFKV